MIVLADTDVVQKLACCGLLLEFLQLLKAPPNEVWVLPALPQMLRRKLATAPNALLNAEQFLKRVRCIPAVNPETLERLASLDPGERQLAALVCDEPRVKHLVTGDKRAIRKMSRIAEEDTQLRARLSEVPILCFESVILSLVRIRGFAVVHSRVQAWRAAAGPAMDGTAAGAFPPDGDVTHANQHLTGSIVELSGDAQHCVMGSC